ncbi:MAG TPA: NAD-dependent epimerase/dehydratase family protein, partial [Candidatus Acidoferrum sp.]|nr:NAD-dependent epimerase/dehydratase family protein [Candidatus Acidoferrum sp.]
GAYGLKTVALRFSNVYGPFSYHKGSVVAQFFRNLLRGEPIVIYGDGEQTRDFLYVADLVDAILLADKAELAGEVFQIASGRETSVRALVDAMKAMLPDRTFDIRFEPARAGEILRNYANIEKARRMLGFDPTTRLDDGLPKTWQWFITHDRAGASK